MNETEQTMRYSTNNKNEMLELFDESDFSLTDAKQFEEQNELINKNNNQHNKRSVDNNMDHCNNPNILHDQLPKVNNHIVYHNPDSNT